MASETGRMSVSVPPDKQEKLDFIALIIQHNPDLKIFSFGIGSSANVSLLSQISSQNNGLSDFTSSTDLYNAISTFYTFFILFKYFCTRS